MVEGRLAVAKELGADYVIKVNPNDSPATLAQQIKGFLGELVDVTIECTGAESSLKLGISVGFCTKCDQASESSVE